MQSTGTKPSTELISAKSIVKKNEFDPIVYKYKILDFFFCNWKCLHIKKLKSLEFYGFFFFICNFFFNIFLNI